MKFSVKPLGELCDLTIGRTPFRGNSKYWDPQKLTKNIWLSIADMTKSRNSRIIDSKEYLSELGSRIFPKIKKGTLLLSFKLSIGKLAIAGTDLQTNEAIAAFTNLRQSEILRDYLYYYLFDYNWSFALEGRFKVKGNTLNKKILELLPIYYPALEDQQIIVDKLDKAFAEIDSLEKNLQLKEEKTNQLLQSMLNAAFTNTEDFDVKVAKLGEVCNLIGGGTPSKANQDFYLGDINWATVRDLNKRWLENTEYKINKKAVQESSTNIIPSGNVVIATRVGLGKVVQLSHETAINQDLRALVPKKGVTLNSNYLFYWAISVSSKIVAAGKGATVQGVTLPFLENLEIILPLPEKQEEIVNRLDKAFFEIDKLKNQISIEKDRISSLRQSILNNAFNFEEKAA